MMKVRMGMVAGTLAAVLVCSLTSCIVGRPVATEYTPQEGTKVISPARAHMKDGSTILYAGGFTVRNSWLYGSGVRYGLATEWSGPTDSIPIESIAALESVRHKVNVGASFVLSTVASAVGLAGIVGAGVAIFGSCPTIYSDSAGTPVLEAESFSYSVAPLFETRDVDLLRAQPDSTGWLKVELRNEMLETHYINALELLEAEHSRDEVVVPLAGSGVLAASGIEAPARAVDRTGRDLRETLRAYDLRFFETDSSRLWNATATDMRDHIDITHPVEPGTDSVALLIRLRSSLLTTVIFYDVMLGSQGALAVDWLERDLADITTALELGSWVYENLGVSVRVPVMNGGMASGATREVARIADPGPVAWKEIAVVVPVETADSLRVRLDFVADNWRIDRISIAQRWRPVATRRLAPDHFTLSSGQRIATPRAPLAAVDSAYLITYPADRLYIHFDAKSGRAVGQPDSRFTYLVAAHGYYTEWVRGNWMRGKSQPPRFEPGPDALFAAVKSWRERRSQMEIEFFASRIPVR